MRKSNLTFSHKLALIFVVAYVVVLSVVTVMWAVRGMDGSFLLEAISLPVMAIVTGYFAKAGAENWNKHKCIEQPTADVNEQI